MIVQNDFGGNGFSGTSIPSAIYSKIRNSDYVAVDFISTLWLRVVTSGGASFGFDLGAMTAGVRSNTLRACLHEKVVVGSALERLYSYAQRHCIDWRPQVSLDARLFAAEVCGVVVSADTDALAWFYSVTGHRVGADFEPVLHRLVALDEKNAGGGYFDNIEPGLHAGMVGGAA